MKLKVKCKKINEYIYLDIDYKNIIVKDSSTRIRSVINDDFYDKNCIQCNKKCEVKDFYKIEY